MPNVTAMGWWHFDSETRSMINTITDQRLVFIATLEKNKTIWADSPVQLVERFEYQDDDASFPIILTTREKSEWNDPIFHFDYETSVEIWRSENNRTDNPSFGLWKRVDDCVVDALLCWPDLLTSKSKELTIRGGRLNGAWQPRLHRKFVDNRATEPKIESQFPVSRRLDRLDVPVPSPWRFVDCPIAVQGAAASKLEQSNGNLYLPATAPLEGFENTIPHLRRMDGSAVMYISQLSSDFHHGEDYHACATVVYIDDEVILHIRCHEKLWRRSVGSFPISALREFVDLTC